MKAMIFAAGLGTRLRPLTDKMPKALVKIGGKTLLQWQIEKLKGTGISDITINIHHFPDMIINFLHSNHNFGCNITISDERNLLLETGGGLKKAFGGLLEQESVLACNVDIMSNINLEDLINTYVRTGKSLLVVSERMTQRYLCFDGKNRLCGWTNIATGEIKGRDGRRLAFSGMQILNPKMMQCLQDTEEEVFSLTDFYLKITSVPKFGEELEAYIPADYRMMDVGKVEHLHEAEVFVKGL